MSSAKLPNGFNSEGVREPCLTCRGRLSGCRRSDGRAARRATTPTGGGVFQNCYWAPVSVVVFLRGDEVGVVPPSHAPAMAEAFGGSPKKRRRSGSDGPAGSSREQVTVSKLEEIHRLRARTEVNFSGHVLAADETVQKRDTFVRGACTQREVAGFIAADASCLVQVALWGDVAKKYFESLTKALDEAADGVFPRIEVTACQVTTVKHPEGTSLRRLASTARTTVKLLESTPLTISPSPRVLTTSAADLMHVPQVSCFMGVVSRLEARVFSQEDVGMREIGISTQNGYEVPVMLYGVQSEEEVELRDRVAVWFGEGKPPLANRDDSKGMIWLYGSGYLLALGKTEESDQGRPLDIGRASLEEDAREE